MSGFWHQSLFDEGVHYEAFGTKEELLDKILYYKNNPLQACSIAQLAFDHYWKYFSPVTLRKEAGRGFLVVMVHQFLILQINLKMLH